MNVETEVNGGIEIHSVNISTDCQGQQAEKSI